MITRIWRGWTSPNNAPLYEQLLRTEIFPGIMEKQITGLKRIELFRREIDHSTEFMTVFRFERIEDIQAMAGEDYEAAYVPDSARKLLSHFDEKARHFESRAELFPSHSGSR